MREKRFPQAGPLVSTEELMDTDQERQLAFMLASLNCARYAEASTHGALLPNAGVNAHSVRRDFNTLYALFPEILGKKPEKEIYPWVVRPEYEKRLRPEGPGGGEHRDFRAILHAGGEWATTNQKVDMPPDEFEQLFARVTAEEESRREKRQQALLDLAGSKEGRGRSLLLQVFQVLADIGELSEKDLDTCIASLTLHPEFAIMAARLTAQTVADTAAMRATGAQVKLASLLVGYDGGDPTLITLVDRKMRECGETDLRAKWRKQDEKPADAAANTGDSGPVG